MSFRAISLGFLAVVGLAIATSLSIPMQGAFANSADISLEPPAPIYEVTPGTRAGYIWSDGYWQWDGQRHRWHPGYWVAERSGYTWVSDKWEQRGDKWHYNKAHWEKDTPEDAAVQEAVPVVASDAPADNAATAKPSKSGRRVAAPAKTTSDYSDHSQWPFFKK